MGFYQRRVLPRIIDLACGSQQTAVPVTRAGPDGQSIPLPDNTCDCALLTWTLCTIPDPAAAMSLGTAVTPLGTAA